MGGAIGTANADILYGVTRTHLVTIDTNNPGFVQVVGAHGLDVTTNGYKSFGSFGLTYNRDDGKLYGLHYAYDSNTGNFDQSLVSYNLQTGLGSTEAHLGNSGNNDYFESLEYVDSLGSLVVSTGLNPSDGTFTQALYSLDSNGSRTFLSANGRDNDYSVYDHTRDVFYAIDPNGVNNLTAVGLHSGTNFDLGNLSNGLAGVTYSETDDAIYFFDIHSQQLVRVDSFRGVDPLTLTDMGLILAEGDLQGLATVVPSPASLMLLSAGGLVISSRRRR